MTEVRVPALGESVAEATLATWYRKAGDRVAADEMLCELETDKVTVEVPAPAAGILAELLAAQPLLLRVLYRLALRPRYDRLARPLVPGVLILAALVALIGSIGRRAEDLKVLADWVQQGEAVERDLGLAEVDLGLAGPVLERVDDSRGDIGDVFRQACRDLGPIAVKASPDPVPLADRVLEELREQGVELR